MLYDLIIKNGFVIDGTGEPGRAADVAVAAGKIAAVGRLSESNARRVIDARGLTVTPGFIDNHTHSDANALIDPWARNSLLQGVTTEVGGNCGISFAPINGYSDSIIAGHYGDLPEDERRALLADISFPEFMDRLEALPMGANIVCCLGQGTLRASVMGLVEGKADAGQMESMRAIIREAMRSGASAMTTGLIYPPGSVTGEEELTELCRTVAECGGHYCTHMRDEGDSIVSSVEEALRTAKNSGVRLVISHHKITGQRNFGLSERTLAMVDEANASGMDVYFDQYPYVAGATNLTAAMPKEFTLDRSKLIKNLADRGFRRRVLEAIDRGESESEILMRSAGGPENVVVSNAEGMPELTGKTLVEAGRIMGLDPYDAMFEIVIRTNANAMATFFCMSEEDVMRIMRHPRTMFGSDASRASVSNYFGHPRAFGTFSTILTKYVRENKVMPLEEMVRKACHLPALVNNLPGKGLIKPGYDADIAVFDYENMKVLSGYANPDGGNEGFRYVLVGGQVAVENDKCTGALAGRLIRVPHK